ncbi:hypothetical protein BDV96DRAFT_600288 [Lophiotrema nucula]|uniref:Rhodopsin domain-containing protein n=1 Tax=Lophiotrema nucula TaxID=690887 RepID=A0A6A5Z4F8_9PLEO|nr:hypothetical protein BDV96DRAFT_600288 [Lophiotrema nucula]
MSANELPIAFVSAGDVVAANIALPIAGLIIVPLRFWMRTSRKMGIQIDDWLILAALVFVIGMSIAQLYGVSQHAVGYPSRDYATPIEQLTSLPPEQRLTELIYWITWLLMLPANGLIKLSTVFLYRRIFLVGKGSAFGITSTAVGLICLLWTIAFFFATVFGCGTHVDRAWGTLADIMSCNTNMRLDAMMISDLITDVMVWALPIPVVWGLRISVARKLAVIAVFMLAGASLAAAVVRLIIQIQISHGGYSAHTNVNLTLTTNLYWCIIESGIALIASCLPTLRVLFRITTISSAYNSLRSKLGMSTQSSEMRVRSMNMGDSLDKMPSLNIHVNQGFSVETETKRSSSDRSDKSLV